ncbi:MAG TPA: ElyC/SanA/YdcF family protein [Propionibacteriaceae bacterium]
MPTAASTRRPRWVRSAPLGIAALAVAALTAVAGSVGFVQRTADDHIYSSADLPPAPVALVLGAAVQPDGTPSAFLAARLELSLRLYTSGKVKVILVSGDNMAPEYNEPDAMRNYLISAGVPANKVVADYAGFDTYDSCARAKLIFGITELVVVTQSYHLPRAVATCRRLGLSASGVGDDTARQFRRAWRSGALRDQLACVKTVIDLTIRRDPVLGPPESSVQRALAG